jgi:hypothetical protein
MMFGRETAKDMPVGSAGGVRAMITAAVRAGVEKPTIPMITLTCRSSR